MVVNQFSDYKKLMKIREGQEWNKTEGIELNINELHSIIKSNPLSKCNREFSEVIPIKPLKEIAFNKFISTQEAFGKIMNEIGKVKNNFTDRIITTSPDVTLHVAKNDAIKIPVGTTLQRPVADASYHRGYIRFNTDTEQFEGFGAGESWAPLGGLTDID